MASGIDIIARGLGARGLQEANRANIRLDMLPNGLVYIGAVDYYNELPATATIGSVYTVKYTGSSGYTPDGAEYVYGTYDGVDQWIRMGADFSQFNSLVFYTEVFDVNANIQNGTASGANYIESGDTSYTMTITPNQSYVLPSGIEVNGETDPSVDVGVEWSYNENTGVVSLSNPTIDVNISANCSLLYSINTSVTNGTYFGDTEIFGDDTASVTIVPNSGYELPSMITVNGDTGISGSASGVTWTYDASSGVVSLSNASTSVAIICECAPVLYGITSSVTNGVSSGAVEIAYNSSAMVNIQANYGYTLPETISVNGDIGTHGTNGVDWSYDSSTGDISLSNPTASISISAVCVSALKIYGVSGLTSSDPVLTRTDDSYTDNLTAYFDNDINSPTYGQCISSFDDVFPWNEAIIISDANGNEFIQMPGMWFRIGTDSNDRITDVAVSKTEGVSGDWYFVDSFCYSRYGGSENHNTGALESQSGAVLVASKTRAEFRNLAAVNGADYSMIDLYHYTVMQFLWWIEFAHKNSLTLLGGHNGPDTKHQSGGTDGLSTETGYTQDKQMRWHYIEDFIGNLIWFVDGSVGTGVSGGDQYVTADYSDFSDSTTNMNVLSYPAPSTSGHCGVALGWDSNNPFLCLPIETTSDNQYATFMCDYASTSNNVTLYVGSDFNNATAPAYGISSYSRNSASSVSSDIGARLLYHGVLTL